MSLSTIGRATRAYSLPASVVPVLLGTVLAARGCGTAGNGDFSLTIFIWTLFGAILAHIGANVLNDFFDFIYGVDTQPEHGSGVLTRGEMSSAQALALALLSLGAAALCGWMVFRARPEFVAWWIAIGLGCAVFYSALLKRFALGDLLIMLSFGVGLTVGAYGVQVSVLVARLSARGALFDSDLPARRCNLARE
jgi:1,4-dihydroxy-2-naphthoate octaprenyltransferase